MFGTRLRILGSSICLFLALTASAAFRSANYWEQVVFLGDSRMGTWPSMLLTNSYLKGMYTAQTNLSGNGYFAQGAYFTNCTISVTGTTATLTTPTAHGFADGTRINVSSATHPEFNGRPGPITVTGANTATYTTTATGGCTNALVSWGCEAALQFIPKLSAGQHGLAIFADGINDLGVVNQTYPTSISSTNTGMNLWTPHYTNCVWAFKTNGYTVVTCTCPRQAGGTYPWTGQPGSYGEDVLIMMNNWILANYALADRVADPASEFPPVADLDFYSSDHLHFATKGDYLHASVVNAILMSESVQTKSVANRQVYNSAISPSHFGIWLASPGRVGVDPQTLWPPGSLFTNVSWLGASNNVIYLLTTEYNTTNWGATNKISP